MFNKLWQIQGINNETYLVNLHTKEVYCQEFPSGIVVDSIKYTEAPKKDYEINYDTLNTLVNNNPDYLDSINQLCPDIVRDVLTRCPTNLTVLIGLPKLEINKGDFYKCIYIKKLALLNLESE